MPLHDHFHPPLSQQRFWHAFHNSWATYISAALNQQLPASYFAQANVQFGIEIDVATFAEEDSQQPRNSWKPPQPTQTLPFIVATDVVEVQIFAQEGGPILAGAIELVSPANKDRSGHKTAFVSKCASLLQQGIGLAIIDVVTDRGGNLHNELLERVVPGEFQMLQSDLYAVAYRAVQRDSQTQLDLWASALHLGEELPTLPLWLRGGFTLPVDLEATYTRTCQEQRLIANGHASA